MVIDSAKSATDMQTSHENQSDPFPWHDMLSIPLHVWLLLPVAAVTMFYLHESTAESIQLCLIGIFIGFTFFTLTSAPKTGHPNAIDCLFDWLFDRAAKRRAVNQSINHSSSKQQIKKKRKTISLKFSVKRVSFHVHHWCYLLMFYWVIYCYLHIYMQSTTFDLIGGFCLGGFVQGLKYDDWHRVVWINKQSLSQSSCEAVSDQSSSAEEWSDVDCVSESS